MPTLKLFDTLTALPLFKGMGHDELSRLAGRTKFDFIKLQAGRMAVCCGQPTGRLLAISKVEVAHLCDEFIAFRLNLLNIVCTKSQRLTRSPWRVQPKDIRHKIARFVETRCVRPAGEKIIKIKMERLGNEINESRLNTSHELNAMEAEGILTLRRGEIHIHALEKIILT